MEHYMLRGSYQDLSAENGIVKVNMNFALVSDVLITGQFAMQTEGKNGPKTCHKYILGYISKVTDEKIRKMYGHLRIRLLEKTYLNQKTSANDIRFRTNLLWQLYSNSKSISEAEYKEIEFTGERIESLEKVAFNLEFEKFENKFSRAAELGTQYPITLKIQKI